jgi:hypothetical protein
MLWASLGHAQAWLPDGGTKSFGVSYTDTFDKYHYLPNGHTIDAGHIRYLIYDFAVAYSPTDYWMFNASVPLVSSEYHGSRPHPTSVDNGSYHSTFTDLRVEAHYQLLQEPMAPVALAPYVAYVYPTHDYETLGHAAPGRGLEELWLGLGVGKSLDKWIPRTYVQGRLTYAWVEKVQGISHNKENIDFDLGYYVNTKLALQGIVRWQKTIGGIDVPIPPTNPLFPYHDQLAADDFTNVGGGASWFASDTSTWSLDYMQGVKGRNGHKLGRSFSIVYSYGFFGFRPQH